MLTLFDLYLTLRQHRRYHPKHPPSPRVASLVSLQKFKQAQEYCRAKSSFHIIVQLIDESVQIVMTLSFLFPKIWVFAGTLSGQSELLQTQLFAFFSGAVSILLELPGSIYNTFVLEAKYGFNRTTVKTFVLDIARDALVSVALGIPILSMLFYALRFVSSYSPFTIAIWLWGVVSLLTLTMLVIYPSLIAPLFNTYDPLAEGELKEKLTALAKRFKFPLDKIYVIDGSRRSNHSNAYVFGLFRKYICIYDSLLEQMKDNEEQIVSILCHELGHWWHSHLLMGVIISLLQVFCFCVLYAFTAGKSDVYVSFGFNDGQPLIIGLVLFNALSSPISALLTPAQNMLSRRFEYEADLFAKRHGLSDELSRALIQMSVANLSNMSPDPLYSAWNYSHPTLTERLDALNPKISQKKD